MDDMETLIQQMAALGISPEQLGMISHQIGRGENMADTPMAEGRHVGNTYVASSPLEHLANALRKGRGEAQIAKGQQGFAQQLQQNQQGLAAGARAQNAFTQQQIDALNRRRLGQPGADDYGTQPMTAPQPIE